MTKQYNNWSKCFKAFDLMFSFTGFIFSDLTIDRKRFFVTLEATELPRCPKCGRFCSSFDESNLRKIRDLDCSGYRVYIIFPVKQIRCKCGYKGNQYIDFVRSYSRQTKRFEEYIGLLSSKMTISDVSRITGIDWKTVKQIDITNILDNIPSLNEVTPVNIGVDEIAYQKGHKYLTVVRDLDLQAVIWVGIGRKTEVMDDFFKELGSDKSRKIETCTMDMWDPYIKSVSNNTNACIIFDKFHIIKKVNEALDSIRKRIFRNAGSSLRKMMKRKRWWLLYKRSRFSEERIESLDELLNENKELFATYILKEQFLDIFDKENIHLMPVIRLIQWMDNVLESGIPELISVVEMIKSHFDGVISYFKYGYTNAASEGFNNKINVLKRAAFGFRDLDYFILKIRQSCGFN